MDIKKRVLLFIIGIIILTLGVALTLKSGLGAGSWDSVNAGLSNIFGLSVGSFAFIIGVIMTIIAGLLRNGKFKPQTLITAFVLGGCTDFWLYIINKVYLKEDLLIQSIFLLVGIVTLAFGLALYLMPNLAPNSLDDCMMAFREKFKLSVGKAKIIVDSIGIIMALIVSGPIGLGTIVITFSVGPLANVFYNRLNKISVLNQSI